MSVQLLKTHVRQCRYCRSPFIFRRFQSSNSNIFGSTLKSKINEDIQDIDLDLTTNSQLFSIDNDLNIFQDGGIFQNSEFKSLQLSNDGFLIQHEDNSNLKDNHQFGSFAILDEEELNINNNNRDIQNRKKNVNEKRKSPFMSNSNLKCGNKTRNISRNNALKNIKLVNKHNDYKIANSLIHDFFQNVIQNEGSIKDYNYQIPNFPNELNLVNLKNYLKLINTIDYRYSISDNERLIFNQMLELSQNILKFDGLLDNEIMNEFIKYFGNRGMTRKIFKILNQFEKLGILPNRDTLHLLIYKLNKISHFQSRRNLLKLYLQLGIREWKISTDLTTKILITLITPPSKERLSIEKILINEGVDYKLLKWNVCEDYIIFETQTKNTKFKKFLKYLIKENIIKNTERDKKRAFSTYIRSLANDNSGSRAIFEIGKYKDLESTQNWYDLMIKSIQEKEFWVSLAIMNHMHNRDDLDITQVIAPVFQKRREVYEFFTKQKLKSYSYLNEKNERISLDDKELPQYMYFCLMKTLEKVDGKNFEFADNFNGNPSFIDMIMTDLTKIKLWGPSTYYDQYANFSYIPNVSKVRCLWDILEMNNGNYWYHPCKLNPLTFLNV